MNYEIIELKEKTAVGIGARTNNFSPDMGNVIGELWQKFYAEGIYASIENKANDKSLGIYTDYNGNEKNDYTVFAACEVSELSNANKFSIVKIPKGRYAKFIVKGDMHKAVAEAWTEIWKMDLPRSFICDFEEYQNDDMNNAEIHIYIGLKNNVKS